jgi:hypothetical protein
MTRNVSRTSPRIQSVGAASPMSRTVVLAMPLVANSSALVARIAVRRSIRAFIPSDSR